MADVQKKKRQFRKFTYRGLEIEQILEHSHEQVLISPQPKTVMANR